MKILVANNLAPFVRGGAEALADSLRDNLIAMGHEAEVLRVPFQWEPAGRVVASMLMARALEVRNADRVIALKFPAYLIRHPAKTIWLLHQFRQAYDLQAAGLSGVGSGAAARAVGDMVRAGDQEAFSEARRIYVNSDVTRERLATFSGFDAEILRPPLNDSELFTGGASDGYIFAGGRVNDLKRQHLLLEALALVPGSVRLVVAGPPDQADDARRLGRLVETLDLADRVTLDLRFLPRAEIARHVNGATAVACLPYDEDSLSYVAMEAAAAGKPILTTRDSGGVLGLARHLETGWVADPEPEALAEGLSRLADQHFAAGLGEEARRVWRAMQIEWPSTIERLLA